MPPSMDETYGAMYIGLLFATFFQGVLSLQTYNYYENFPEDPRRLKIMVAGVWVLDATHLVLIAQAGYHYFVTNWGNGPALMYSTQELDLHLAFLGLASIICQGFFLQRIWVLSHKSLPLVIPLAAGCLATLALDLVMSAQISKVPLVSSFGRYSGETVAIFAIGAGVDVAIALVLCFYLHKGKTGFSRSNFVIARIMQYTVATGFATSMLAVACLIAYVLRPDTFIFIAMHFSLGRMYTNALLATLNSRRTMRSNNNPMHMDIVKDSKQTTSMTLNLSEWRAAQSQSEMALSEEENGKRTIDITETINISREYYISCE